MLNTYANLQIPWVIFIVTLVSTPENKRIFAETSMLYMSVRVKSYKSNSPAQCFAYQRFGYSSLHCGYAPRCVKWSGPHLDKDSSKTKEEEDSKCTNCEGAYIANYSKYIALIHGKTTRRPNRPNTLSPPNTRTPSSALDTHTSTQNFDQSKLSYASITATNQNHTNFPNIKAISA